jgi:hypothetical protein
MIFRRRAPPPPAPHERVIERPDGYYWESTDGNTEYGPFATLRDALADMEAIEIDEAIEEGESLAEAQSEIGMADWIDPDTGAPAEEEWVRIEDH